LSSSAFFRGVTWGYSSDFFEEEDEWSVWQFIGGGAARFSGGDFGKLELAKDESVVSDVHDLKKIGYKYLTLAEDLYGTGSGSAGSIQWRGSNTPFNPLDGAPSWEDYIPANKNWRYVQVKYSLL
jgi:hypothetical protein